jgi:sulfate adenylyltransferase subunit 2
MPESSVASQTRPATSAQGLDAPRVWDIDLAHAHLAGDNALHTRRTTERRLHELELLPAELNAETLRDEYGRAPRTLVLNWALEKLRSQRKRILFVQLANLPNGLPCLHANDPRGTRFWVPLNAAAPASGKAQAANKAQAADQATLDTIINALAQLQQHIGKDIAVFPHGELAGLLRNVASPPANNDAASANNGAAPASNDAAPAGMPHGVTLLLQAYQPVLNLRPRRKAQGIGVSPHLKRLEAESIHIIREAVAEAQNPAMLYSVGKDSGVMLHLARKAFYPAPPPFPLLHVDTRWKFQEMYLFRDYMAAESGMDLLVHINPEAIEKDINPFDHGSSLHTDITKTEGLKQALDKYKFDVVFGGARRDEEKSRAKERVFSFRTATHRWDPKNQRPELWNLYNTRKNPGESIRVFPLSNWTELDIWQYIYQEDIPVVPLYFSEPRPVVVRDDMIMMVDDDRCRLTENETIEMRQVRFRTLGCYPLTGAVESKADTLDDILLELINARTSERQGRKIDTDSAGSMEKKKQEGYF